MSDKPKISAESSDDLCKINHSDKFIDHFSSLLFNADCSDVTLYFDGCSQGIPAHKLILAARSEYFRAQFYHGFSEERGKELHVLDVPSRISFELLLRYIYTGQLSFPSSQEDIVLDILSLSHKYMLNDLQDAISTHLRTSLSIANAIRLYEVSTLYNLTALTRDCISFMDKNATEVMKDESFYLCSGSCIKEIINRDSFCAPEVEIFRAVQEWIRRNPSLKEEEMDEIRSCVRLDLLSVEDMLTVVRPSNLFDRDRLLDAISDKYFPKASCPRYRGLLLPEVNAATRAFGALVIQGDMKKHLLDGDHSNYDHEKGFTRHTIGEDPGICIELGSQIIINHIQMLLWDKDDRSYSYYIEGSTDNEKWQRIVDYSHYHCRSLQKLYFAPRVVKYIRIVGTKNTIGCVFNLVSFECKYTESPAEFDEETGLVIAKKNVASVSESALVHEGVSRSRNALINGDFRTYDWDTGYTCHQLGSGSILLQLAQPYLLESMRLLLWDIDSRCYSYYIEVSVDKRNWHMVTDKRKEDCSSWQLIRFPRRPVVYIRIVGTRNTANEVFHCVHFECPSQLVPADCEETKAEASATQVAGSD